MSREKTAAKKPSLAAENRAALIRRFGAKARCAHSQKSAYRLWRCIIDARYVSSRDVSRLSVAWAHAKAEEGPAELDALVKEITADCPPNILRRKN